MKVAMDAWSQTLERSSSLQRPSYCFRASLIPGQFDSFFLVWLFHVCLCLFLGGYSNGMRAWCLHTMCCVFYNSLLSPWEFLRLNSGHPQVFRQVPSPAELSCQPRKPSSLATFENQGTEEKSWTHQEILLSSHIWKWRYRGKVLNTPSLKVFASAGCHKEVHSGTGFQQSCSSNLKTPFVLFALPLCFDFSASA